MEVRNWPQICRFDAPRRVESTERKRKIKKGEPKNIATIPTAGLPFNLYQTQNKGKA